MRKFSNGWRRKAGCVTLLLACVIAGAWARSLSFDEGFFHVSEKYIIGLGISSRGIRWSRYEPWDPDELSFRRHGWDVDHFEAALTDKTDVFDRYNLRWRFSWCGLDFGECFEEHFAKSLIIWRASYLTIIVPLTLLSGYLLLVNPRSKKPVLDPA